MKKLVSILLILSFCILVLPSKAVAQEEAVTTVKAGLTTESPFYFLDRWVEVIELFFTPEGKKAEKMLEFAEERLAEMEEVTDVVTPEELEVLGEQYQKELDKIEQGEGVSEEVKEKVREAREKHIQVLERVKENAPEQAQPKLEQVVENAREKIENQGEPGEPNESGQDEDSVEEVKEELEEENIGEKIKNVFNDIVNREKPEEVDNGDTNRDSEDMNSEDEDTDNNNDDDDDNEDTDNGSTNVPTSEVEREVNPDR
jgi:hypothetical protein